MEKKSILICGQLGAGCREVGEMVSKELGLEFLTAEKLIKTFDFNDLFMHGELYIDEAMRIFLWERLRKGGVLVEGRAAFLALDQPVNMKVFLYADQEKRAEHIAERSKISKEEASAVIEMSDHDRSSLAQRIYNKDWQDSSLYDMKLETSRVGLENTAKLILTVASW